MKKIQARGEDNKKNFGGEGEVKIDLGGSKNGKGMGTKVSFLMGRPINKKKGEGAKKLRKLGKIFLSVTMLIPTFLICIIFVKLHDQWRKYKLN